MRAAPALRHQLIGATRKPDSAVAIFHGLGGCRYELLHVAESWSQALPSTAFLLLESPDRDYHDRVLLDGSFSGDWYPFPLPRSAFGEDEEAYTAMVVKIVSDRCDLVSRELDGHLAALGGVRDERLILAGFSQGAAVSAYTGLRRRCLGVLPMGGPCPPRPALLPDNDVTRVCAVVGERDPYAPHADLAGAFEKYAANAPPGDATCGVQVIPKQGHTVSERSIELGLAFLRRCLSDAPSEVT